MPITSPFLALPSRISANVSGSMRIEPRAIAMRLRLLLAADVHHMRLAGGIEMSEFRHGWAPSEGAYHSSAAKPDGGGSAFARDEAPRVVARRCLTSAPCQSPGTPESP